MPRQTVDSRPPLGVLLGSGALVASVATSAFDSDEPID